MQIKFLKDDGKKIVCDKCLKSCKWYNPKTWQERKKVDFEMVSDCCNSKAKLI